MCILAPLISIMDHIQPICQYTHRLSLTVPLKSCHTFSQISLLQYCFSGNHIAYSPSIIYALYALGFLFQISQWALIQYGSNIGKSPYMCYPKLGPIVSLIVFIWISVFLWEIVVLYLYFRKICQITLPDVNNHIQKYHEHIRFEKISRILQKIMTLALISNAMIFMITMFVIFGVVFQSEFAIVTKIVGIYHIPTILESIIVALTVYSMATENDYLYQFITSKCKQFNCLEAYRNKKIMDIMKETHSNSTRLDIQQSNGSSDGQSTETKTQDLFEICGVDDQSHTNNKINCTSTAQPKDVSIDIRDVGEQSPCLKQLSVQ